MPVWRYQLEQPFTYKHEAFDGIDFENPWITITHGQLTIRSGYAWDGCSPKISLWGLSTLGTPDGVLHRGKPWTYNASLVHDALCQYRDTLPLGREQVTQIFDDMLLGVQWPLRWLYVLAVRWFGPRGFAGDRR